VFKYRVFFINAKVLNFTSTATLKKYVQTSNGELAETTARTKNTFQC